MLQQQLEMEIPFQPTAGSQLDWWIMKPRSGCRAGQGGGRGGGQGGGRGDERGAAAENGDSFSNRQSQLEADNETCSTSVEAPATQIQPSSSLPSTTQIRFKQTVGKRRESRKAVVEVGQILGESHSRDHSLFSSSNHWVLGFRPAFFFWGSPQL